MKKRYNLLTDKIKGYVLMSGFSLFATIAYLMTDLAFRKDPLLTPQTAMFWGFFGANVFASFGLFSGGFRTKIITEIRSHGKLILGISFLTAMGAFLWFWAMNESNASILSFLSKSEVLLAAILGLFFLGERFSIREVPGMILMALGIFLLANLQGEISLLGVFLIILCKFFYAVQSVLVKKFGSQIDAKAFTVLRAFFMLFLVALFLLLFGKIEWVSWPILFILGIGQISGVILARVFYFEAHKYLPVSKLNFFTFMTPVITLLGSFIFLHDSISSMKIIGATLILVGLFFFTREQIKLQKIKIKKT